MSTQEEWIKENYKNIEPWKCSSCGKEAVLHECVDGVHKFYCNKCISKREGFKS